MFQKFNEKNWSNDKYVKIRFTAEFLSKTVVRESRKNVPSNRQTL